LGSLSCQLPATTGNLSLTHSTHEGSNGIIRQSLITSNSALDIGDLEVDLFKLLPLIIGNRGNQVIDSRDQDLSLG
jgi:hypothetical protein